MSRRLCSRSCLDSTCRFRVGISRGPRKRYAFLSLYDRVFCTLATSNIFHQLGQGGWSALQGGPDRLKSAEQAKPIDSSKAGDVGLRD